MSAPTFTLSRASWRRAAMLVNGITAVLTIVSGLQYAWQTGERLRATEPRPAHPATPERAESGALLGEGFERDGKIR